MLIDSLLDYEGSEMMKCVSQLKYSRPADVVSEILQDESKGCDHH
jgi:hypothetical protein